MNATIEKLLNEQIGHEHHASLSYLNMATWADLQQCCGAAHFLYNQSKEERGHMMKIIDYLITLGKQPLIKFQALSFPSDYPNLKGLFEEALAKERKITQYIHKLTAIALAEKDFSTFEFLQWFVAEQREEEDSIQTILGMFDMVDKEGVGYYTVDQAIKNFGQDHAK